MVALVTLKASNRGSLELWVVKQSNTQDQIPTTLVIAGGS